MSTTPCDALLTKPRGHVRMRSSLRGLFHDQHNLVVNTSVEMLAQAMIGRDMIASILFGYSGGVAAAPGQSSIYNPVYSAPVGPNSGTPPFLTTDELGYASIVTWTGVYTNPGPSSVSYDMLGLVSQNSKLFAATSFPVVTVLATESIAVEWTILLRGR